MTDVGAPRGGSARGPRSTSGRLGADSVRRRTPGGGFPGNSASNLLIGGDAAATKPRAAVNETQTPLAAAIAAATTAAGTQRSRRLDSSAPAGSPMPMTLATTVTAY